MKRIARGKAAGSAGGAPARPKLRRRYKPVATTRYWVAGCVAILLGLALIVGAMSPPTRLVLHPENLPTATKSNPFVTDIPGLAPGGLVEGTQTSSPKAEGEPPHRGIGGSPLADQPNLVPVSHPLGPRLSARSAGLALPGAGAPTGGEQTLSQRVTTAQGDISAQGDASVKGDTAADSTPLIVLGAADLRWDTLSQRAYPEFFELLPAAQVSNLVIRSVGPTTCETAGWLTLSAGRRSGNGAQTCPLPRLQPKASAAAASSSAPAPTVAGQGGTYTVSGWSAVLRRAKRDGYGVRPGTLGQYLSRAGVQATAVGEGAGVALANRQGQVAAQFLPSALYQGATVDLVVPTLAQSAGESQLTVIDLVGLAGKLNWEGSGYDSLSARQVALATALVGQIRQAYPQASLILASLWEGENAPRLHAYAAWGPRFSAGLARSTSVRRPGLVQLPDISATILHAFAAGAPTDLAGTPVTTALPSADATALLPRLVSQARRAAVVRISHPVFLGIFAPVVALTILGGVWALNRRTRRHLPAHWPQPRALLRGWRFVGLWIGLVPACSFLGNLLPWWLLGPASTEQALWPTGLLGAILPFVLALAVALIMAVALLRSLSPLPLIAWFTLLITLFDPLAGSPMMIDSVMGDQTTVAGRFYGVDNMVFALLATSGMVVSWAAARPLLARGQGRAAGLFTLFIGTVIVLVDGLPAIGADFGGPIAAIPGFLILALLLSRRGLTWWGIAAVPVLTLLVVGGSAYWDWLRPPTQRTHLGNFVQTLLDGGAGRVAWNKATQIFYGTWSFTQIGVAAVACLILLVFIFAPLWRDYRYPGLLDYGWLRGNEPDFPRPAPLRWDQPARALALSWTLMIFLAVAVNDSSVLILLTAFSMLGPALLAQATHHFLENPQTLPAGQERATPPSPEPPASAQLEVGHA